MFVAQQESSDQASQPISIDLAEKYVHRGSSQLPNFPKSNNRIAEYYQEPNQGKNNIGWRFSYPRTGLSQSSTTVARALRSQSTFCLIIIEKWRGYSVQEDESSGIKAGPDFRSRSLDTQSDQTLY